MEVPDYLARFDVCLNLLRRSEQGNDVVPCRIYEYLSSGKPVVSMLFPEQVEHFPDVVYGAHSPEEFAALCRRALAETATGPKPRREHGAAAAWSAPRRRGNPYSRYHRALLRYERWGPNFSHIQHPLSP